MTSIKNDLKESEVRHVAELANIELSDKELKLYTKQLQSILKYMVKLGGVDTSKVMPTYQTLDDSHNIFRKDEVRDSFTQKEALSQADKTYEGYFVAEHVFGDKRNNKSKKIIDTKRKKIDSYNAILTNAEKSGNIGYKDLFVTKGIETTAGSKVLEGYIPQYSATTVNLLEKCGFRTKYKLNQDAWGHGSSGENSDFGPTENPWDRKMVPGGSSSGSAVVVSTGDVEYATGTDTCGSIRMPSSFTNVVGIKPTYGAISRYGVIAFASSLDCPGLFARTVKSLWKVFQKIYVSDEFDATSQSIARNKNSFGKTRTVGLPKEFLGKGIDVEVKKAILDAAELLKRNGYKVVEISLPHSSFAVAAYYIIAPTETSSNLARYDGVRYGNDRSFFGSEAKRRIMLGSFASSAGYSDKYFEKAARVRTLIIEDFNKVFKGTDVVLAPVSPTPPFSIGEKTDDPLKMYLSDIYTAPASLAGLPSLALPSGFSSSDLPIGMQLIGPRWSEEALFDLGEKYQTITNWHKRKPNVNI